jgi:hypothetical protein
MAFLEELRNSMGGGSPTKGAAKSVDPNDLKDLGLGGLPSFLGTREDAAAGKRGDAQIAATLTDSLPGYFNPETRDYVPWYVDLFDGGGINRSAGMLSSATSGQSQSASGAMSAMQPQGLLANNQLSDMEMANRARVGADPRNLGGSEGYGSLPARDPRNLGGAEGYGPIPTYASLQQGVLPQDYAPAERYASSQQGIMPQMQDNMPVSTPAPRESTLNTLRENVYTVGPIEAMVNAYNNRPDIPLAQPSAGRDDTPRLSDMQSPMMQHPAFPQFVNIMKGMGNESVLQNPEQASFVFNNYLKQIGYN